jgi:hypothetical protein
MDPIEPVPAEAELLMISRASWRSVILSGLQRFVSMPSSRRAAQIPQGLMPRDARREIVASQPRMPKGSGRAGEASEQAQSSLVDSIGCLVWPAPNIAPLLLPLAPGPISRREAAATFSISTAEGIMDVLAECGRTPV